MQSQFHWVELLWKKAAKRENQLTEFALYPSKRMKIFKQKIKRKASNSHDYNNLNFLIDDILISKGKAQNVTLAFGRFDKQQLFINYKEDDNIYDITLECNQLIWI